MEKIKNKFKKTDMYKYGIANKNLSMLEKFCVIFAILAVELVCYTFIFGLMALVITAIGLMIYSKPVAFVILSTVVALIIVVGYGLDKLYNEKFYNGD